MRKYFLPTFITLIFSIGLITAANSENARVNYFVNCSSADLNLTFEMNTLFRTVRNVNYNTEMDVAHWSEEAVNTYFSIRKSLSQIVSGTQKTENVGVNFNRLKGSVSVAGINSPTKSQIKECQLERDWGCDDWFVTEIFDAKCSIIEQKF
tara:strand:- start:243 stop:695 length:453 start_codon:yes stop_codon:yes gene_type:complete